MALPRALKHNRRGFTLVEVMLVAVVIALLAAIAVIQYQRARISTFEQLALGSLRLINGSCQMYSTIHQRYPPSLSDLGAPISNPPYLYPDMIGNGTTVVKQGYQFTYAPIGGRYTLLADPVTPGTTGIRHFYTDESMIIRADPAQPADASDPALS